MLNRNKIGRAALSIVLAVVLAAGNAAAAKIEEMNVKIGYEADLLETLGIMKNDNSEKELSRVDFMQMLSKMLFYKSDADYTNIASGQKYFDDVENYHYAASNIERLYQLGVLSGDGDLYARPDDPVTYPEAYVMMLNAAGYGAIAKASGEYPENYMTLAAETELSKDVDTSGKVTKASAAKMLVNLMDVEVVKAKLNESVSYEKDEKFMTERMGLKVSEGILQAAGDKKITNKHIGLNDVIIDGTVYENKFEKAEDFVGFRVKYYYDEENAFVYATPVNNVKLTVSGEDVENYSNRIYTYTDENEKTKKARIDTNVELVYNGEISDDVRNFIPAYGDITMIDNDSDGYYEVLFVEDYDAGWIESIVNDNSTITFKNALSTGETSVSLEDYAEYAIYDENGMETDFSQLSDNRLVTIQRCKKEKIKVFINNESLTGTVENVKTNEKYSDVTIDGEVYRMNVRAYKKLWENRTGVKVTVYFDSRNQISAVVGSSDGMWMYAFVITAKPYQDNETDRKAVKLKILNQSGAVETHLITDEKIRTDGEKHKLEDVVSKFQGSQLIRYMTKDSKITAIDFPEDRAMTYEGATTSASSNSNTLLRRTAGDFIYRSYSKIFKRNTKSNVLDGEIVPRSEDIPIFYVPKAEDMETASNDAFNVKTLNAMAGNVAGKFEGYSCGSDDFFCDAIVAYNVNGFTASSADAPVIISDINRSVNDNDEEVYKINGYVQSAAVEYYTSTRLKGDVSQLLQKGDIVRFERDSENKIVDYKLIYSAGGGGIVSETAATNYKFDEGNAERYVVGYAKDIRDGVMQLNNWDDDYPEFYKASTITCVLIFDPAKKKNSIAVGDVNDIITKKISVGNYDKVIVFTHYTEPRCVWVIKR